MSHESCRTSQGTRRQGNRCDKLGARRQGNRCDKLGVAGKGIAVTSREFAGKWIAGRCLQVVQSKSRASGDGTGNGGRRWGLEEETLDENPQALDGAGALLSAGV